MKKIVSFLLLSFLSGHLFAQSDSLVIKGKVLGLENGSVFLSVQDIVTGKNVGYRVNAANGYFEVNVRKQPGVAFARMTSSEQPKYNKTEDGKNYGMPCPPLDFFVSDKNLSIDADVKILHLGTVKGDQTNDEYTTLRKPFLPVLTAQWNMQVELFTKPTEASAVKMKTPIELEQFTEAQKKFIATHKDSYLSLHLLSRMGNYFTTQQFDDLYNGFSDTHKNTPLGKQLMRTVLSHDKTAAGKQAMEFTKKDVDGNMLTLSSLKGKVVILDFWGSWCGPCRYSHPHLKEIYTKFKDKGLEIIGIAEEKGETVEASKQSWKKAIKDDGIYWKHVLNTDEDHATNNVVKLYQVSAFPTKILLDREGKIVLRVTASANNDLEKMLEQMLGK